MLSFLNFNLFFIAECLLAYVNCLEKVGMSGHTPNWWRKWTPCLPALPLHPVRPAPLPPRQEAIPLNHFTRVMLACVCQEGTCTSLANVQSRMILCWSFAIAATPRSKSRLSLHMSDSDTRNPNLTPSLARWICSKKISSHLAPNLLI